MIEAGMWIVTAASLVGVTANIYKRRWCFVVWMVTNAIWVVYDLHKDAVPQATLMAVYFVLAVWGYVRWTAGDREKGGRGEG